MTIAALALLAVPLVFLVVGYKRFGGGSPGCLGGLGAVAAVVLVIAIAGRADERPAEGVLYGALLLVLLWLGWRRLRSQPQR